MTKTVGNIALAKDLLAIWSLYPGSKRVDAMATFLLLLLRGTL